MTCPLLSAARDIISWSSQAEFLLHRLMPARAWIQQQCNIPTPLPRYFPLRRNWQRVGIELAPHHRSLMIRRAGQAWRGMSAAIIYCLPRSSGAAARPARRGAWLGDARCPRAPGGAAAAPWAPLARGCACRHGPAFSEPQTLWFAALCAALTLLSLRTQCSSGVPIWIMRRMHNPIAAVHFSSSRGWHIAPVIPQDYLISTTVLLFQGRSLAGMVSWKNTTLFYFYFVFLHTAFNRNVNICHFRMGGNWYGTCLTTISFGIQMIIKKKKKKRGCVLNQAPAKNWFTFTRNLPWCQHLLGLLNLSCRS